MFLFSDGLQSINNNNRRKRIVKNAYIPSRSIRKIPPSLHPIARVSYLQRRKRSRGCGRLGFAPNDTKARAFAAEHQLPFIALEDGFTLARPGSRRLSPPYSIVYDNIGIYYDTTRPSRLEQLILAADAMPSETLAQARQAMDFILKHHLSKYNHAPELSDNHPLRSPSKSETVLIIDQTFGDMTIQYGGADASTFELMFQTALNENPQADIWVKTHPDVLCGKKQGYLTQLAQQHRVHLLAEDINPISLLQNVDKVYCVTSQMGFEALLCGKPVPPSACRGMPDGVKRRPPS